MLAALRMELAHVCDDVGMVDIARMMTDSDEMSKPHSLYPCLKQQLIEQFIEPAERSLKGTVT